MTKTPSHATIAADDQAPPTAASAAAHTQPKARKAKKTKPRRRKGTGTIFGYRGAYRAEITLPNGEHRLKDGFETEELADQWLMELLVQAKNAALPELGGPTQCTLAEMMWHYLTVEALSQYDAALAMSMHSVVEVQSQTMAKQLERQGLDLEAQDPAARVRAFRSLGSLEAGFFAGMSEAIEKEQSRR